jgi:hypothetical protein
MILMAKTPNHWLIGVLPGECDANGTPRFVHKLQTRFVGGRQNFRNTLIRKVTGTEKRFTTFALSTGKLTLDFTLLMTRS